MTTEQAQRVAHLAAQLAEILATASYHAYEIRNLLNEESPHDHDNGDSRARNGGLKQHPFLNKATFSVTWQGRSARLGHTRSFWLLDRLLRRPNQFVTHLDLLTDVWENDELTTATIRSAIRHLKQHLRRNRMTDLAAAIRGHNGHYILEL